MSDKAHFDVGGEFTDRNNYKSYFARSMAVNSQFKEAKSLDLKQLQPARNNDVAEKMPNTPRVGRPFTPEPQEAVRLRKNIRNAVDDTRRYSCSNINSNRRISMCSSRISEIPVENIVNQSKIETLQWQLKEIQKSREMYRAVMKQVVTFLEKAHHSLELLGCRMNRKNSVTRSKSEHQIVLESTRGHNDVSTLSTGLNGCLDDYLSFKDWRQTKEDAPSPDEVPPEKLSQEAFRLLRTAQSLLNTREPDLAQVHPQPEHDAEFLAQLAREFPSSSSTPEHRPHRAASFSLSPKLILPETACRTVPEEVKICTAFNRKLSLQLGETRGRRQQLFGGQHPDSARGSVADSDTESPGGKAGKSEEKPASPATGSVSSMEDESGFSSMNSFQEVGLPPVNSTISEEVSTKTALLRSMLHNNSDYNSPNFSSDHSSSTDTTILSNGSCGRQELSQRKPVDEFRLWQKPSPTVHPAQHKRWNSSPSEDIRKQSLKVLWV